MLAVLSSLVWSVLLTAPAFAADPPRTRAASCTDEANCLRALPGLAARRGDRLTLQTGNGPRHFDDENSPDSDQVFSFRLTGFRHGYFIIESVMFGEHAAASLTDQKTGAELRLPNAPDFSPSGRRFFVTANFGFGGDDEPYLQIFEFQPSGVQRVFVLQTYPVWGEAWGSIKWAGDDLIVFTPGFNAREAARLAGIPRVTPLHVKRVNGVWRVK